MCERRYLDQAVFRWMRDKMSSPAPPLCYLHAHVHARKRTLPSPLKDLCSHCEKTNGLESPLNSPGSRKLNSTFEVLCPIKLCAREEPCGGTVCCSREESGLQQRGRYDGKKQSTRVLHGKGIILKSGSRKESVRRRQKGYVCTIPPIYNEARKN